MFVYELQIPDTARVVLREKTDRSMKGWHGIAVRKALRYKRVPEDVKEQLRQGNSIVGWANADQMRKELSREDFVVAARKVFKGMDNKHV